MFQCMWKFKTGDLIAQKHPNIDKPLRIGIVISDCDETILVKWTSFNSDFFMEKEGDIFGSLNNFYLLSLQSFNRRIGDNFLCLLSAS